MTEHRPDLNFGVRNQHKTIEAMIRKLHNPIVGDTLEIVTEGKDTNGAYHLIEAFIPKGCPGPVPHYHMLCGKPIRNT